MPKVRLVAKMINTKVEISDNINEHVTTLTKMYENLAEMGLELDDDLRIGFMLRKMPAEEEQIQKKHVKLEIPAVGSEEKRKRYGTSSEANKSGTWSDNPHFSTPSGSQRATPSGVTYQSREGFLCHECRQPGHFRKDCPQWKHKLETLRKNKQSENYTVMFLLEKELLFVRLRCHCAYVQ
jgi:hypothetical protein